MYQMGGISDRKTKKLPFPRYHKYQIKFLCSISAGFEHRREFMAVVKLITPQSITARVSKISPRSG